MADVYERSPKKWYLRGRVNGKRVHLFVATTKSDAQAALKEFQKRKALNDLDLPDLPKRKESKPRILFDELAIRYADHCMTDKSRKTYVAEISRINVQWLPTFKGKYLDEITPLQVQAWKDLRVKDGIKSHTLYNELKVLKTMFSRAIDWGLFDGDNPVKKLPKTLRKQIHFLSPEEVERYLACCSESYLPMAATLVLTGIRKGELLDLRWSDIDFKKRLMTIRSDSSLKNSMGRDIPISSQLLPLLASLPRICEYVFPGADGKSKRNCFDRQHREARRQAGLPNLTIHHLRHTFASLAIQEGFDVGAVSKLLGHSSLRVTMEIYHHLNPDHARKVIEGLPITIQKK